MLSPRGPAAPAQVIAWAAQAAASSPGGSYSLHTLGMAHYRAGDHDRAQQCLHRAAAVRGNNCTFLSWLGQALVLQRQG